MGPKGPTLHEVAVRAGVSIATVSRVARGLDQISEATRSRVLAAIEDLNYRPSHFGQALVRRRHGTLGIVFPGLRGPYYSEVIHGFELEAIAARMSLLILGTELLREADAQVLGMADRADGLAIMGGTVDDFLVRNLARRGTPLVTLARYPFEDIPNARVDNYSSTLALVTHLIREHGYTRLIFAGAVAGSPDGLDRWRGFARAHEDADLAPPPRPIHVSWEQAAGAQVAMQVLDMDERPHAIVCGNDEIATGMLGTFAARGVRVPHEIAVTGWDDGPYAQYSTPPLTTISQPARALGQQTATTLLRIINGDPVDNLDVVFSTEPVIRASCGCTYDPMTALSVSDHRDRFDQKGALTDHRQPI